MMNSWVSDRKLFVEEEKAMAGHHAFILYIPGL